MGHQFTPTYPKLKPSYVQGVLTTKMELFNTRKDISYYSIGVFDKDWNKVAFATDSRIVQVGYLNRKSIDVYIRGLDKTRAVYICSQSKMLEGHKQSTIVSSKICSKIK